MWAAFCFCVPAAESIDLCKRLLSEALGREDSVWRGQLGAGNADSQLPGVLVSIRHDHNPLEERLVETALEGWVGCPVDLGYVVGQLQSHAEQPGVKVELLLGRGQGLLSCRDLPVHALPLSAEGIGRHVAALLGVEPQQSDLFAFQLVDQLRLDGPDFLHRLLADSGERFDGFRALGYLLRSEPHLTRRVVVINGALDQFGANVDSHLAGAAPEAARAEQIRVLRAVLATAQAVDESALTLAAVDSALEVVIVLLGALA